MKKYARISGSIVAEIIQVPVGLDLVSMFHGDIVSQCTEAPAEVEVGWQYDGKKFHPGIVEVSDIEAIKVRLKNAIDIAAENERLKYITPGDGQAMTYRQKVDEARAYKAASNPKPADYPVLSSEVGITAETLSEVADIVLAAFVQWQQIGAMIESIRLGAKRDIDAASDEAQARTIIDAIVWPSARVQL
nr:hypothetical protein [Brucella anthropi]